MTDTAKPKLLGLNHIALEVGDIDEALAFYGRFFDFELRGRDDSHAFIDMGDQFLALSTPREQGTDVNRHFGLVVDDRDGLRDRLAQAGVTLVTEDRLDFLDPWGNRVEVVAYADIQFAKTGGALRALGAEGEKTRAAQEQRQDKGLT